MNDDLLERLRNLPPEPPADPVGRRDQVRNRVRRGRVVRVGGITAALGGVVLVAVAAVAVIGGGNDGTETVNITSPTTGPTATEQPAQAKNVPAWSSALSFHRGADGLFTHRPDRSARLRSSTRLEVLTTGSSGCPSLPLGQPVLSAHRIDLTIGSHLHGCVLNLVFFTFVSAIDPGIVDETHPIRLVLHYQFGADTTRIQVPPLAASHHAGCPSQPLLAPGPDARSAARAAAVAAIPRLYGPTQRNNYIIGTVTSAAALPDDRVTAIPFGMCGSTVGSRTWVVEMTFPDEAPSASLSSGQLFLGRFSNGWRVWFQYH
jgi:hypothetical protein